MVRTVKGAGICAAHRWALKWRPCFAAQVNVGRQRRAELAGRLRIGHVAERLEVCRRGQQIRIVLRAAAAERVRGQCRRHEAEHHRQHQQQGQKPFFHVLSSQNKKFCPPETADRCSKTGRTKFLRSAMQLPVPAEMPAAFGYSDLSAFRRLHSDRLAGLFTRIPPAARSGEDCAIYSFGRSVSQPGAVVNPFSDRIRGRSGWPTKRRSAARRRRTRKTPPDRSPGVH